MKRLGIGVAIALTLFVLVVFVLPTPIARYVIESQLDGLRIEHTGIDTIEIDLWNSQVRAGPIGFRAGDAREGQLGEVSFDYSFAALFKGRGFVSTFIVSGVDIRAARHADGSITLNGVNLTELGRAEGEAAAEAEPTSERGSGFGVGVERFEFRDSNLLFEDITGGSLAMGLDRLTVDSLRTWSPEEPTRFSLAGHLNEMQIAIDGTVFPLADPLRLSVDTRIRGITIDRLARFTGPTGLERRDGNLETHVSYDYALHRDGLIEGTVHGTYHLGGLDIATPGGDRVALGKATVAVDLDQRLAADGSATVTGRLRLDSSSLSVSSAAGDAIEIGALELNVDNLNLTKQAEKRRALFTWTPDADDGTSGPKGARSIVELAIDWAEALARDLLSHVFEVDGRPTLRLEDGRMRLAARGETPAQELSFAQLEVVLEDLQSEAFDAGLRGSVSLETVITGLIAAAQGDALEATLANLRLDADGIEVSVTPDRTTVAFPVSAMLEGLAASDARFGSLALRKLSLVSEGISLEETAAGAHATGPLVLRLEGLESALAVEAEGEMTARGETLELNLPSLSLGGDEALEADIAGRLDATELAVERSGASPLAFALASSRTDIERLRVAPLNAQAAIQGDLSTTLSELSLHQGSGEDAMSASLERLEHRIEQLRASGLDGHGASVSLVSRVRLDGLEASLPLAVGQAAEVAVASLAIPSAELAVEGMAARAAGALEIAGITARAEGDSPQSLDLAALSVAGFSGDNEAGVAMERIELGELRAELTLPLPDIGSNGKKATDGEPAGKDDGAGSEADSTPAYRRIELGELTLAPGSRIEVTDKAMNPPVRTSIAVEQLKVGPIDSGAPETRTDIAASIAVNEASKLSLEGWASPLSPEPDLDLVSQLKTLSLPPFSPYAASFTGVNIESGMLWMTAGAKADKGKLEGKIDLRIDELFVTPISEEEAKAIEASTGLPVGFAVSILKDDKGVIELGFPVSGRVAEPEVDFSEAINKALSGAMASLFPTNWFGDDGHSFRMKPALFEPGTAELTTEGKAVADQIGSVFSGKPNISLRACGRAARADLLVLRGAALEPTPTYGSSPPPDKPSPTGEAGGEQLAPPQAPAQTVAPPSEKEVEALLALASKRGTAVREYLSADHGIDPGRVQECRTAYSIEDGKPPRAEFLL